MEQKIKTWNRDFPKCEKCGKELVKEYSFGMREEDFDTIRETGDLSICMRDGTWIKMVFEKSSEPDDK